MGCQALEYMEQCYVMSIDTEWFHSRIREKYGSLRAFARAEKVHGLNGPLAQPNLTTLLNGKRPTPMLITEAVDFAEALEVPVVEIIQRAGVKVRKPLR